MGKRRRLGDLYKTGKLVSVDDGTDDPIEVWIAKLSPFEREEALRMAGAAKAKALALRRDRESDAYLSVWAEVHSYTDVEPLIRLLVDDRLTELSISAQAELELEDGSEWADGNLQGLVDSWDDGLEERFAEDPDDPEAKAVFDQLKRFNDQVSTRVEPLEAQLMDEHRGRDLDELLHDVTEKMLELQANAAFVRELERAQLYLSVREPDDRSKRYFASRAELLTLEEKVLAALVDGYRSVATVDAFEGKDSDRTPDSSPPSDPPAPEATAESSGLVAVPA